MSDDWKNDRAEASMREEEVKNMAKAKEKFKLTNENDPRKIEYYQKAFPELTVEEQEALRISACAKLNIKL
jgi:hypothetical protein